MNYKFRGKECYLDDDGKKVYGKWVYGYLMGADKICPPKIDLTAPDFFDIIDFVAPETVGQWTGLLDKNGKEIYEGDIIKKRTSISLVSNDFFYDACDFLYKGFFLEKIKSAYGYCLEFEKTNPEYEIIGNKIDNPELLEGK